MATRAFVPRADGEGKLGTAAKKWGEANVKKVYIETADADTVNADTVNADTVNADTVIPETEGNLGTEEKQWKTVHAETIKAQTIEAENFALEKVTTGILDVSVGINTLQRNKTYAVGDIAYSPLLPSWARLECITAGTTGAEEPELLSAPPMDNSKIGTYITDGTVVWIVDDVRDGTPVGSVRGSLYLPKGYIKANGATVNRADYPRLVKFIETNNLWTDEVEGNLGLFGKGDGSTTFVVPNYVGRMVTYKDTGAGQTIAAGLPNITGAFYMDSYAKTQGTVNGCFTYHDGSFKGLAGANLYGSGTISIDASLSNPIYGASDTVQPPAISLIPVIRY